ncbi:hypothetical protein BCR43DRAFT_486304 [Syncephalastrum racemosum]|uniref:Uncharacterized protein n=1 Tax=Syncephalastrum racemosum TaxID=13706 RepID=A0A1X2HNU7_SYNRA|nr:hypothetical protein BCR43DRAFT_486304 [Syncephalastrum racemosum]
MQTNDAGYIIDDEWIYTACADMLACLLAYLLATSTLLFMTNHQCLLRSSSSCPNLSCPNRQRCWCHSSRHHHQQQQVLLLHVWQVRPNLLRLARYHPC